jgi:D-arabinose 1-dehydrogenase-like Zn-dependent alcohol dehydrogenase
VLGIINKPGCFAQYITLPIANLHVVPAGLSDAEAAFCEPLAAACRILEQGLLETQQGSTQQVAVVGECYGCGVIDQDINASDCMCSAVVPSGPHMQACWISLHNLPPVRH